MDPERILRGVRRGFEGSKNGSIDTRHGLAQSPPPRHRVHRREVVRRLEGILGEFLQPPPVAELAATLRLRRECLLSALRMRILAVELTRRPFEPDENPTS
jgi:hypothetical protein